MTWICSRPTRERRARSRMATSSASPIGPCQVSLEQQLSKFATCEPGVSFGCVSASLMWTKRGCRGKFTCGDKRLSLVCDGEKTCVPPDRAEKNSSAHHRSPSIRARLRSVRWPAQLLLHWMLHAARECGRWHFGHALLRRQWRDAVARQLGPAGGRECRRGRLPRKLPEHARLHALCILFRRGRVRGGSEDAFSRLWAMRALRRVHAACAWARAAVAALVRVVSARRAA